MPYGDMNIEKYYLDIGLLTDGARPLPETMLTIISDVLWHSH